MDNSIPWGYNNYNGSNGQQPGNYLPQENPGSFNTNPVMMYDQIMNKPDATSQMLGHSSLPMDQNMWQPQTVSNVGYNNIPNMTPSVVPPQTIVDPPAVPLDSYLNSNPVNSTATNNYTTPVQHSDSIPTIPLATPVEDLNNASNSSSVSVNQRNNSVSDSESLASSDGIRVNTKDSTRIDPKDPSFQPVVKIKPIQTNSLDHFTNGTSDITSDEDVEFKVPKSKVACPDIEKELQSLAKIPFHLPYSWKCKYYIKKEESGFLKGYHKFLKGENEKNNRSVDVKTNFRKVYEPPPSMKTNKIETSTSANKFVNDINKRSESPKTTINNKTQPKSKRGRKRKSSEEDLPDSDFECKYNFLLFL